jgi:hypothetical protein
MNEIFKIILLAFVILLINGCKKEDVTEEYEFTLMLDCELLNDKSSIENSIIGEWKLVAKEDHLDGPIDVTTDPIELLFSESGTMTRKQHNEDNSFRYNIIENPSGLDSEWGLNIMDIQPKYVRLEICEDELLITLGNLDEYGYALVQFERK